MLQIEFLDKPGNTSNLHFYTRTAPLRSTVKRIVKNHAKTRIEKNWPSYDAMAKQGMPMVINRLTSLPLGHISRQDKSY